MVMVGISLCLDNLLFLTTWGKKDMKQQTQVTIVEAVFLVVVLVLSGIVITADPQDWENLVDNGFNQPTNYSTRGIEIFNGELYVGTESFNKVFLGGGVTGVVYGNQGGIARPLASARVQVLGQIVDTGSDGSYMIGNLVFNIPYAVTASKEGYTPQTQMATPSSQNPVVQLDFILNEDGGGGSGNGSISGTVYGKWRGNTYPLAFARVQTMGKIVYTNLFGSYSITDLPLGPIYTVTASKFLYYSQTGQVQLSLENPQGSLSFVLEKIGGGGGSVVESEMQAVSYEMSEQVVLQSEISSGGVFVEAEPGGAGMYNMGGEDFVFEFGSLLWLPQFQSLGLQLAMHARSIASNGGELWKYTDDTGVWTPVIANSAGADMAAGFGYSHNLAVASLKVFNGHLYAGTWSTPGGLVGSWPRKGCEIWRYDGFHWDQVVGHEAYTRGGPNGGFGNPNNIAAWKMEVFNGYLYVGTMNWDRSSSGQCQIWRTNNGVTWEKVVDRGFRDVGANENVLNTYVWNMEVFQEKLYVGTFNSKTVGPYAGAQVWRTADGTSWSKIALPGGDGFGESENYGIRSLKVYNDELYVGTAASAFQPPVGTIQALEIWKYDGAVWTPIVGDDVPGAQPGDPTYDGFGNYYNKYAWSMEVSDGKLWVGTANTQLAGGLPPFETQGCEIWSYDGLTWIPTIKNEIGELPNGFGKSYNIGARSMIEYPEGSGKLFIGTFKLKAFSPATPEEGCAIWRYIRN